MTPNIEQPQKNAINIVAIVHDDVPEATRKTIYADHFQPLVKELESFTDRKVNVIFGGGAPYSNFAYRGEDTMTILRGWEALGYKFLDEMRKEGFDLSDPLTKVILVTHQNVNIKIAGIALLWPPTNTGTFAIASLNSFLHVGHEIGHLLGANHENWEVQYNGWWAETYMVPERNMIRSISYTFSSANRQNIKNYLADKK
ncbi:hypothetical protein [Pseudomonas purpurea]|uniref:hypothetical protein n=1 Tax=Pseudomonas purpurea TaxID=3136737 RepID=UPI0032637C3E